MYENEGKSFYLNLPKKNHSIAIILQTSPARIFAGKDTRSLLAEVCCTPGILFVVKTNFQRCAIYERETKMKKGGASFEGGSKKPRVFQ